PAAVGVTQADPGLDANGAAGEAHQDWGQSGQPLEVRDVSTGGSRRATGVVRPVLGPDRPAAAGMRLGLRLVAPRKSVRTSSPGVRRVPWGPNFGGHGGEKRLACRAQAATEWVPAAVFGEKS